MTFDAEIERPRRGVWFRARAVYPGEMPLKPRAAQRTQCAGAWPPTGSAANKTWIGRVAFVRTRPQGPGVCQRNRKAVCSSTSGRRPRTRSRSSRPRRSRRRIRIRRSRTRTRGLRSPGHRSPGSRRTRGPRSRSPWLVVRRYAPLPRLPCRIHRMSPD